MSLKDIRIAPAVMPRDLELVRQLFREYAQGLGVDLSFQHFEEELAQLPGKYAAPRGTILLAHDAAGALGCGALRPLETPGDCEMKRLYVRPAARGLNLGRHLAEALIGFARTVPYSRLLLDTLASMHAAHRLYGSLGFKEVPAYVHNPLPGTKFMGLSLQA